MDYASASAASPLLQLPIELLIPIASELGYFDLRHLEMVCKRFQKLMEEPQLQSKLFRRAPTGKLARGDAIAIHPMFESIDCTGRLLGGASGRVLQEELITQTQPRYTGQPMPRDAFDYAAVDEFATMPASEKISIIFYDGPWVSVAPVRCTTGVTIRMVLNEVLRAIRKKACPIPYHEEYNLTLLPEIIKETDQRADCWRFTRIGAAEGRGSATLFIDVGPWIFG